MAWGAAGPEEVAVTRRLYRDGTSEYFLNKTPCRLRDITDFFLGTGVGTKAYAIIEQGRIGQIVSSRPEDRRAIIEEAAGITKFKAKKKAAEKTHRPTRQNLMRVSDIVGELDKRMGSLRRQAQKAERYKRYKAELKDIELWTRVAPLPRALAEEKSLDLRDRRAAGRHEVENTALLTAETSMEADRLAGPKRPTSWPPRSEDLFALSNRAQLGMPAGPAPGIGVGGARQPSGGRRSARQPSCGRGQRAQAASIDEIVQRLAEIDEAATPASASTGRRPRRRRSAGGAVRGAAAARSGRVGDGRAQARSLVGRRNATAALSDGRSGGRADGYRGRRGAASGTARRQTEQQASLQVGGG